MRAAYLGPEGTNSHEALVAAGLTAEYVGFATVGTVVAAVQRGEVDRALVPIENSREGGVGATLDALVFDAPDVEIVAELVHRVTYCLVAGEPIAPDEVRTVHSHPQATGQCARFLSTQLPGAAVVAAASTADAARLYGASVLAEGIEDDPDNATRFAWIGRMDAEAPSPATPRGAAERPKT